MIIRRNSKKKFIVIFTVILVLSVITVMSASANKITVEGGSTICKVGKTQVSIPTEPFTFKGQVYLPIDNILPPCGIDMGWDNDTSSIICKNKNKDVFLISTIDGSVTLNGEKKEYLKPVTREGIICIGEKLIDAISGYSVEVDKKITDEYKEFTFVGKSLEWDNNGKKCEMKTPCYLYGGNIYFSVDDVLPKIGYTLGWQDDIKAVVCVKNEDIIYIISQKYNVWVNEKQYIFETPSLIRDDRLYISGDMLEKITGGKVYKTGEFEIYYMRDLLENTTIDNKYRLAGKSVASGGGVTAVDGFGMEFIGISDTNAQNYAGVINAIAKAVPDVQVFNIAVPTASEFYAPLSMKSNQLNGIRTIYKNLDKNIVPINAVKPLYEHAGEKIYFATDHHWTQRGAYYVYAEFLKVKGLTMDPLSSFENKAGSGFVGSLAGFSKGSAAETILRSRPEIVERFIPKYATVGTVYEDMNMTKTLRIVNAVNTNTASYMAFIGGDGPVTAFYTDAPSNEVAVIVKESFGNAFATWALNNYKRVYVIDPRKFNGFGNVYYNKFNIATFCKNVGCNDLIMINYPGAISSGGIRQAILDMTK
ncbi:MAG: hypothetical protein IJC89_04460 [Clostridia bacterium]|nr:hypothetical protein [Clostridia bacterium]